MRLVEGFVISKVGDDYIAVATGKASKLFSGMIKNNETGAFILRQLQEETNEEKIVEALLEEYEADAELVRENVHKFVENLRGMGVLVE